ncbi:MAG: transglycosylase [Sideroxydans sp.]|nr:transglycosylase [Sideroxydans sp.]
MLQVSRKWLVLVASALLAACTTTLPPPAVPPAAPAFAVSKWAMLPDWESINLTLAWPAFLQSCRALQNKPHWQEACTAAAQVDQNDAAAQRAFYETWFTPYQVYNPDGSDQGLITGYYEPRLYGSRVKTRRFRYPLYAAPDDLLTIELSEVYPQLKGMRLRGRLEGNRVVPYYSRAEIDAGKQSLHGRELFWVDNAVDLFFLQVQGSGRIELPDGSLVKVGYANQNGYPYVSIGRKLVDMGELTLDQASMQSIKEWAEKNPDKLAALLEENPSYVFFRELPDGVSAPLGALGVPLTGKYSLAVDARTIPLGAPVFLATSEPDSNTPLNRLMLAQDTGGAIKGAVRADFFWGFGDDAGAMAGRMKQQGRMWVLFPKGVEPALN